MFLASTSEGRYKKLINTLWEFAWTEDEIYAKNVLGFVLQFVGGFDIPLQKSNRSYLRVKVGLAAGTPIKYADLASIEYVNSAFAYTEKDVTNYGLDYIIRIN